jgi:hypothetical protein
MQLEGRAAEWLESELRRGETIQAVAPGTYPDVVRGSSIWIVAIGGAVLGTGLEALGIIPSPFGLFVALIVAVGGWYAWLVRRPGTIELPGAPWPLIVVTNRRIFFLKRGLVGGDGSVAYVRDRSDLKRTTSEPKRGGASRTVLQFAGGPDVRVDLQRANAVTAELAR